MLSLLWRLVEVQRWTSLTYPRQRQRLQVHKPRRMMSCKAAGCEKFQKGWLLPPMDTKSDLADFIRFEAGKRFTEEVYGGKSVFIFYPGQNCFDAANHQESLEVSDVFIKNGVVLGVEHWIDELHNVTE